MAQHSLSPSEMHLIKKEIETLGDFYNQERLERTAETEKIRIELEAMRVTLNRLLPGFIEKYDEVYREMIHQLGPENRRPGTVNRSS